MAKPELGWCTKAEIVRSDRYPHDGDTVRVKISRVMDIRLLDCWCPETKATSFPKEKKYGIAARDFLRKYLDDHPDAEVRVLLQGPEHELLSESITMGRILGRIYIDDVELSELMVREGFAFKTKEEEEKFLETTCK